MKWFKELRIKYHSYMREFYTKEGMFNNYSKTVYHDMKLQRLESSEV